MWTLFFVTLFCLQSHYFTSNIETTLHRLCSRSTVRFKEIFLLNEFAKIELQIICQPLYITAQFDFAFSRLFPNRFVHRQKKMRQRPLNIFLLHLRYVNYGTTAVKRSTFGNKKVSLLCKFSLINCNLFLGS